MARISEEVIEGLKQTTDLVAVIKERGVTLRKRGKQYKGHCPFHPDEKTPSFAVTPAENLWHCFGCDTGGDVIRFVELMDKVSFPEAVKCLNGHQVVSQKPSSSLTANRPKAPVVNAAQRTKLLTRVVAFYQKCFANRPEGMKYLVKQRGFHNVTHFKNYQIGYADGSLLEALPQDDDSLNLFKALGVLTGKGRELLHDCVVFPLFDDQGNVVNLYGRRVIEGEVNHLYLPGPKVGLWNYQAAKRSASLLLTESVIDAFTLIDHGLHDVMPCYGVHGLTDDLLAYFEKCTVKDVTLCFDGDDAGQRGVEKVGQQLKEKRIAVHAIQLPEGEDVNSFLNRHPVAAFQALLNEVNPDHSHQTDTEKSEVANAPRYEKTDHGFKLFIGPRCFEVKAIARTGTQLKATIKASVEHKNGFELHTLDLYSARSREAFARSCVTLFDEDEPRIKTDLITVLEQVESWQPNDASTSDKPVEPSAKEKEEALAFLKQPDLLDAIQHDMTTLGVAGEDLNKVLCYLAATSRKLDDPLSLLIQSRSAAGKSTLQNAVLALVPDEDKVVYTRMTDQALFYQDEMALVHKVLALEEAEGLGGAAYSLRALQSSKSVSVATTSKDPVSGRMKTEHYTVHGPIAVMLTTTQADLDEETCSRFLTLTIDESEAMTQRIFESQRHADTLDGVLHQMERHDIVNKHHTAQRLLESVVVINPYAKQLSFPSRSLRARRDNKKYLMLIKVIAFLHQHQREIKEVKRGDQALRYIEVSKDDIRKANALARHVLGHSLDELSAPARNLLTQIHAMVKTHCEHDGINPGAYIFTRKTIREATAWSDFQVRTHIKELENLEYLKCRAGAWGKEYVYELVFDGEGEDGDRFGLGLVDPDSLIDSKDGHP
ncbi:MAG: toprim domain-containing protein [Ectothiorhodospiraceae bacterium]|nr:toprim domain-containing protein [Ectothiorhodospiraceae bacterium]